MTREQIANLLTTIASGAVSAAAQALLSSGVNEADVQAGLDDALAEVASIKSSELAAHAAQWADLRARIGG